MKRVLISLSFVLCISVSSTFAQLSGDLLVNSNFYVKDTSIGATTSQYLHEFSSSEAWLFLNYSTNGFAFSVRYDLFNNSALLDPNEVYTDQGLGFFSVNKKVEKLDITAGYFYDQFGTGIIFRAFEDRTLGLDYAVNGLRLKYDFSPDFRIKAFTGRQKNRFNVHPQVLKGIDLEKDFTINDNFSILTGAGFINRTLDQSTMILLANEINSYKIEDRFIPKYNLFAATVYSTIIYKDFSLYAEYAHKTAEAIRNQAGSKFISSDGNVLYASLTYSRKGIGINVQHKRSDHFSMRSSPFNNFLVGTINYLPPMSKQHSKALAARYSISAIEFGENSTQAEITISPNKKNTITGNMTYVEDLDGKEVFREYYLDYYKKFNKKLTTTLGLQSLYYDIYAYQNEPEEAVRTITPLVEIAYKFDRKKSLRTEFQYLFTKQDHGDFFLGLIEYTVAPNWSFSVADMVNTKPLKLSEIKHYYNFAFAYTLNQMRISLAYAKQVEGIVCTGGVCRVEPAFSGLKLNISSSF